MVLFKLSIILISALSFFALFVFGPFYDQPWIQTGVLLFVMIWSIIRFSFRETVGTIKFCLPFVVTLFIFGLIFHLIRLQGRDDWLFDTLIKCLIFPSSLIYLKILLTYISYIDILSLPISMKRRIDLITMKSAFQKGGKILKRFSWYLNTYSAFSSKGNIKKRFMKYASLVIALYLYLYEEIENSNGLLKNRYTHLRGEEDK